MAAGESDVSAVRAPSVRREVVLALVVAGVVGLVLFAWGLPIGALVIPVAMLPAVAASVVDVREKRLPNRLILPASTAVVVLLALAGVLDAELGRAVVALSAGGASMFFHGAIWWLRPAAFGYGDVKLAGLLGMATGWVSFTTAVSAVVLAFVLAAVPALGMLLARRARGAELPMGPFMVAAAIVTIAWVLA